MYFYLQIMTVPLYQACNTILCLKYNDTVLINREQVDDAPERDIWFRYFHKKYRHVSKFE